MGSSARNADLTDKFNTPLSRDEETAFQIWRSQLPPNLHGMADYDLRGAYKANAQEAGNGHLTDIGKKPNHMTYSTESAIRPAGAEPGEWIGEDGGPWTFQAGRTNLEYHSPDDLLNYFQTEAENGATRDERGRIIGYGTPNRVVLPRR